MLLANALFAATLSCGSFAQKPAAVPAPNPAPKNANVFEQEVTDPSKLSSAEALDALHNAANESGKKLDGLQKDISQTIDTIEKAEFIFRNMVNAVDALADRLKPGGTFDSSMEKLALSAEQKAKEAEASQDPDIQAQGKRFLEAAKGYREVKADAAQQYQEALNLAKNLNSNKIRVINEIHLKAHAKATELSRQYLAETKKAIAAMQSFAPKPNPSRVE
jgi:hypothetical protein